MGDGSCAEKEQQAEVLALLGREDTGLGWREGVDGSCCEEEITGWSCSPKCVRTDRGLHRQQVRLQKIPYPIL